MKFVDGICTRTGRFKMRGWICTESDDLNKFLAKETEAWLNKAWYEDWLDYGCVAVSLDAEFGPCKDALRVTLNLPFGSSQTPSIRFSFRDLVMDRIPEDWRPSESGSNLRKVSAALRALADEMDVKLNQAAPATPSVSAPGRAG